MKRYGPTHGRKHIGVGMGERQDGFYVSFDEAHQTIQALTTFVKYIKNNRRCDTVDRSKAEILLNKIEKGHTNP